MSPDERADQLAQVACELVTRLRDEDPRDVHRWLRNTLPDAGDWFALALVLAAAVPDDRPWLHLTAWTHVTPGRRQLRPCGTPAAYARHKAAGEDPCTRCEAAVREYDRDRKRLARAS